MSAREQIAAQLNGQPASGDATDLCAALTEQLGLAEAGRRVTGAAVFGRGPQASVDVLLDEGKLTFERFSDIAKPQVLGAYLVTLTGVYKTFKGVEAGAIAAAVFRLATHHAEDDQDEATREWGLEFLRLAPVIELDMNDQAERWRAFGALAAMNPAHDAGDDRSAFTLAQASAVLVDRESGVRYIRGGWFQQYVKREVGGMHSPAALTVQMARVGWLRINSQGRVNATNPADGRRLSLRFYMVPADWEHAGLPPDTAPARAHVRTRDREEPAVTRYPAVLDPADARPAPPCHCDRPLPAPDDEGELRCARCGRACTGWGVAA